LIFKKAAEKAAFLFLKTAHFQKIFKKKGQNSKKGI